MNMQSTPTIQHSYTSTSHQRSGTHTLDWQTHTHIEEDAHMLMRSHILSTTSSSYHHSQTQTSQTLTYFCVSGKGSSAQLISLH